MARPSKSALKLEQHHNSKLNQDIADKIANAVMENKTLDKICEETGLQQETAHKYIRGVKVDIDYPETREEWNEAVQSFLGIAIYKATKRMAQHGMEEMPLSQLPVAMAISVDKKLLMEGTPTNITANMSISVNHRELLNELRNKPTNTNTSDVVDV
jgi:hypothetical protein